MRILTRMTLTAAAAAFAMAVGAASAQEVLKLEPGFSTGGYLATLHYKHESDREHHREGLLKAGLPD